VNHEDLAALARYHIDGALDPIEPAAVWWLCPRCDKEGPELEIDGKYAASVADLVTSVLDHERRKHG
jgi:hypothetical protein